MSILYIEEHKHCKNYMNEGYASFSHYRFEKGEQFTVGMTDNYLFLFALQGRMEATCLSAKATVIKKAEMYALEHGLDYTMKCMSNVEFIMLAFDKPVVSCDEFSLIALKNLPAEKYCICSLPILPPLKKFLNDIIFYLDKNMYCKHLQDLKQSEWFFLMRAFYTKEQNSFFFSSLIKGKEDFVLMVKEKAARVSSVKELAEACNLTPKTLTRNFKKYFRTTPKQWLLLQKKKSVQLGLLQSKEKMDVVSQHLGFASGSHLNSYCKRFFDQTSREIKNDLSKRSEE